MANNRTKRTKLDLTQNGTLQKNEIKIEKKKTIKDLNSAMLCRFQRLSEFALIKTIKKNQNLKTK